MAYPTVSTIVSSLSYADWYWSGPTITYSIPVAGSTWPGYAADKEPFNADYAVFNATQADRFRAAIASYDRIIAPSLRETDDLTSPGQIRVAFTDVNETVSIAEDTTLNGSVLTGTTSVDGPVTVTTFTVAGYDTVHDRKSVV